jgi:hypothetical protein
LVLLELLVLMGLIFVVLVLLRRQLVLLLLWCL